MIKTQIAIFGGGVAGLWLLNGLRQQGISCVLIENNKLGSGQTLYSQGIIHGGLKYALTGTLTASAQAMQRLPELWRACLQGEGEIDLSQTKILSSQQYLWSSGSLGATVMTFLASKSLRGQVERVKPENYPEAFATPKFKGAVYALQEPVLAVKTLVENLATPDHACLIHADLEKAERSPSGYIEKLYLKNSQEKITLSAKHLVLLAGKGNPALAQLLGIAVPKMQLRPLSMVAVTAPHLPVLFAHAMQTSNKPRITITTHQHAHKTTWYLGGDLAETGVKRSAEQQIDFARKELNVLFPQLDFSAAEFQVFFIERAEALSTSGLKPDSATVFQEKNVITAWPTKLAFAPILMQQIMEMLSPQLALGLEEYSDIMSFEKLKKPVIANYPWE